MAKLMVTNLEVYGEKNDQNFNRLIQTSKHILDEAITHIREICYNLMPSVLIKGNIEIALSEFVKKLNSQNIIRFHYKSEGNFDNLNSEIEIVIFRIVQEFINNSIKHSKAKNVTIVTKINWDNNFFIELKDDGVGFNLKKLKPNTDGRGINNLKTKVNAFEGEYSLTSKENEGTRLKITFPKIN
jgi:signal transduction histidine kinase